MSDYRPLRIAEITDGRDTWQAYRLGNGWESFDPGVGFVSDSQVTDIRPLVVLDLDDFRWAAMVLRDERIEGMGTRRAIVDQIEAQTKPPKPVEPRGIGAVVEDDEHRLWVRHDNTPGSFPWVSPGKGVRGWSELHAVKVLSEGVSR